MEARRKWGQENGEGNVKEMESRSQGMKKKVKEMKRTWKR